MPQPFEEEDDDQDILARQLEWNDDGSDFE